MSVTEISAQCASCNHTFAAAPKKSFLGFQKVTCPACSATTTYPLTKGYRITYAVIFAWMALSIALSYQEGVYGFPGGIGIAVIVALCIDFNIRKKLRLQAQAKPGD